MAWIEVTDPQGNPVWLSVGQLVRVRLCLAGVDFLAPDTRTADTRTGHERKGGDASPALAHARSIVDLVTGGVQAVRETQDEILERIEKAEKEEVSRKAAGA
jgi:hypothetical protein